MSDPAKSSGPRTKGDILLEIRGLQIEGESDEVWRPIVKGVDLTLKRGEVLGLIGESGAGKSTIGLAAMGYARGGCRISGGSVVFDGIDLLAAGDEARRKLRGSRIAYVAQSAAASFNPAHQLMAQTIEAVTREAIKGKGEAEKDAVELYRRLRLPNPEEIGFRYPHQVSGG
ncbi:MAG TPA: ATP-binding cassette domain-containing protein, partial [Dongiaceae bacterium]|nr:ATP-binding cassette domain-containing protein [Dongiaceae bacterium]